MGQVLFAVGYLLYLAAALLSFGALFNACAGVARGQVGEAIFMIGLAVVIGWIGQLVGGILAASGSAIMNRHE